MTTVGGALGAFVILVLAVVVVRYYVKWASKKDAAEDNSKFVAMQTTRRGRASGPHEEGPLVLWQGESAGPAKPPGGTASPWGHPENGAWAPDGDQFAVSNPAYTVMHDFNGG